jgi:hypothetical protein
MQTHTQLRVFVGLINVCKCFLAEFGLMFISDAKVKVSHFSLLLQLIELIHCTFLLSYVCLTLHCFTLHAKECAHANKAHYMYMHSASACMQHAT